MVCDLAPKCNFHFGYFSCNLPEDTIYVDITVHTLKGIHTFRKDQTTKILKCSPWGLGVRPFPSLRKKMKEYMEERQAIANPFSSDSTPPGPIPHHLQIGPKPPHKREEQINMTLKNFKNQERWMWDTAPAFQWNLVGQTVLAEAMPQASSVQMQLMLTFMQPATTTATAIATATAALPLQVPSPQVTMSSQTQLKSNYCATCIPLGKPSPATYSMSITPNWLNSEEG